MTKSEEGNFREELERKYLFLHFVYVVAPGAFHNDAFYKMLDETKNFISQSSNEGFINQSAEISRNLDYWILQSRKYLQPKAGIDEISREFAKLLNEQGEALYSNGVTFGWLNHLIDCTQLGLLGDLPYHAKIEIASHAGNGSVEEAFLLHDAFSLLLITRACHKNMQKTVSKIPGINSTDRDYLVLSTANQNVGSVARLCVFSYYAFVEAFVNSIGNDFAARNESALSVEEKEILNGKKRGRYLSLEQKMEAFQKIIRPDKKSPVILTDSKQHKEPFLTFFSNIKNVRDASAHFGVGKVSIWRSPKDWLDFANTTSNFAISVASDFWELCFSGRLKPEYLLRLDYQKLQNFAVKRLDISKRIFALGEEKDNNQ